MNATPDAPNYEPLDPRATKRAVAQLIKDAKGYEKGLIRHGRKFNRMSAEAIENRRLIGVLQAEVKSLKDLDLDNVATQSWVAQQVGIFQARLDTFKADIDRQLAAVEVRLDGHDALHTQHAASITEVRGEVNGLTMETHMNTESIRSINREVRAIQRHHGIVRESGTAVLIKWIIAIAAGLIAMIIWSKVDLKEILPVSYGDPIIFNYQAAESWLGTGIVGVAIGVLFGAILLVIPFQRRTVETTTTQQQSVDETVDTPVPENPHPVTRALPAVAGNGNRGQEG